MFLLLGGCLRSGEHVLNCMTTDPLKLFVLLMTKKPHPLTDKMIENKLLNRLWWELETCQLEP